MLASASSAFHGFHATSATNWRSGYKGTGNRNKTKKSPQIAQIAQMNIERNRWYLNGIKKSVQNPRCLHSPHPRSIGFTQRAQRFDATAEKMIIFSWTCVAPNLNSDF